MDKNLQIVQGIQEIILPHSVFLLPINSLITSSFTISEHTHQQLKQTNLLAIFDDIHTLINTLGRCPPRNPTDTNIKKIYQMTSTATKYSSTYPTSFVRNVACRPTVSIPVSHVKQIRYRCYHRNMNEKIPSEIPIKEQ